MRWGRIQGGRKREGIVVMASVLSSNFATIIDSDFQANKFITNASDTPSGVLMRSVFPSHRGAYDTQAHGLKFNATPS